MLHDDVQLPELRILKSRNDSINNDYVDYSQNLLSNMIPSYLYNNPMFSGFLTYINSFLVLLFDQVNIVKNFKIFTVSKYYYKNKN